MPAVGKQVDPAYSARLKRLQATRGFTDQQMAEQFGVRRRTYLAWKYRECNPGPSALVLLAQFERPAKIPS